ncbi:MAG: DUF4142 domain-containing protein [Gemmatimonadota bacterium]
MTSYPAARRTLTHTAVALLAATLGACGGSDRAATAADSAALATATADTPSTAPPAAGTTTMANATLGDTSMVQLIVAIDRAEAAGGKLASTKATQPDVKAYGRTMMEEHEADLVRIRQIATAAGIPLDTSSTTRGPGDVPAAAGGTTNAAIIQLEQNQQQTFSQLQVATGADFGRQYLASQLASHQQVIDLLRLNEGRLVNPDIRAHVSAMSAAVAKHLARAKQLQQKVGGDGATTAR